MNTNFNNFSKDTELSAFNEAQASQLQRTPSYVDLGLPSGTLWATENIKDTKGNDLYFAWGETRGYTKEQVEEGKKSFAWSEYEFGALNIDDKADYGMRKYNETDGRGVLEPKDDAATVNWGEDWRIPTKKQFDELKANTKYEWAEIDGVPGAKFTSIVEGYTDRFVFFPAAGYMRVGTRYVHIEGDYWLASLNYNRIYSAFTLTFDADYNTDGNFGRCCGCLVRPVRTRNI